LRPDEIYNHGKVEVDDSRIGAAYGFRRREAGVRERQVWDENGQVSIHYDVEERPPATVGEIKIIGNEVTRQNVIHAPARPLPRPDPHLPGAGASPSGTARAEIF